MTASSARWSALRERFIHGCCWAGASAAGVVLLMGVVVLSERARKARQAAADAAHPWGRIDGWLQLSGDPVMLEHGRRYRGCVRMGIFNPIRVLATIDRVRAGLEEKGFADVMVAKGDAPAGWPADVDCVLYVECTWSKPDEALDRPSVVDLDAWVMR